MFRIGAARRIGSIWALALCAAFGCSAAFAQIFPAKPVRLVVPYAAGGIIDATARIVAEKLADIWSQPVVVENLPGVAGVVRRIDGGKRRFREIIEERVFKPLAMTSTALGDRAHLHERRVPMLVRDRAPSIIPAAVVERL